MDSYCFCLRLRQPLAEKRVHGLPAFSAAHVDRGDDLEGSQPLHEALHLREAAVLAVGDTWQGKEHLTHTIDSMPKN